MITTDLTTVDVSAMPPGTHIILLVSRPAASIAGRMYGLELRDTILIVGPVLRYAFLLRKPIKDGIIQTLLRYGTGALNINGCKIGSTGGGTNCSFWPEPCRGHNNAGRSTSGETKHGPPPPGWPQSMGRWPSNIVFVHAETCQDQCDPRCPVSKLDEISGERPSAGRYTESKKNPIILTKTPFLKGLGNLRNNSYAGESGGASRFFPVFKSDVDLRQWLGILIGDVQ